MAALSYAHGITWNQLMGAFPWYFDIHPSGRHEVCDKKILLDQINFLQTTADRRPAGVLEIGGGRGDVANVLKYMKTSVTSVELSQDAVRWYEQTGKHFFGGDFEPAIPMTGSIDSAIDHLNLTDFDTIVMVESLEHIPEESFAPIWDRIVNDFRGLFIVTNWFEYHPINVGQYASAQEHCRLVDDKLYDTWTAQAKRCVYRNRSHLVLEF